MALMPGMPIKKRHIYQYFNPVSANNVLDMAIQTGLDMVAMKMELPPIIHPITGKDIINERQCGVINLKNGVYLGTHGKDYGLAQYIEMVAFTEVLVQEGNCSYVAGDIINEGRQAYIVLKTADYISFGPAGRPDIECYFYVSASHDGSITLRVQTTPVSTLNNTVLFTTTKYNDISIKHTKHVTERLGQAKHSISRVKECWNEANQMFKMLSTVKLTPQVQSDYLMLIKPDAKSNKKQTKVEEERARILGVYQRSAACQLPSTKGTLLGLFIGVSEYYEHFLNPRKRKHENPATARLLYQLTGTAASNKAEAYAAVCHLQEKFTAFKNPLK